MIDKIELPPRDSNPDRNAPSEDNLLLPVDILRLTP